MLSLQKLNDFLMRPWQMGHALSGTQEHLVEAMVVPLLKITKTMLSELLDSGSTEVRRNLVSRFEGGGVIA